MNSINATLKGKFTPTLLIACYEAEGGDVRHYLESHEIGPAGEVMEGKPLKTSTIHGMVDVFSTKYQEEKRIGGAIPPCLLAYVPDSSGYTLAWHRPAEQRTLWFAKNLHIPSGPAMVPPMLYIAKKSSLSVWALRSNTRPTAEKLKVYDAPFHNVSAGAVCLGSAKAKADGSTFTGTIQYWEDMFWNSEFSHINGYNPLQGEHNLNLLWQEQVADPKRPFPLNVLKEATKPMSLSNLINLA